MAENSVLCGELRAPRCPGFYRLVLHALPHLRLRHRYRRTKEMFIMCPATIRSENMSEQAQGDLLQTPVTGRRTSTGKPVTAWNAIRKGVTGKEFTLTSWKTEIAKCRRARTTWTMQETHRWSHTSNSKIWEECVTAEHKVLIETCESGNNHQYAIVGPKCGSSKIRDETKLLKANMESFRGIWHLSVKLTMELLKSLGRHLTVQKDLRFLNSGTPNGGRNLCVTVAIDHSTVGGFHDELQLSAKNT